nr:hypothetical protein [Patescibacteria group bacterium]
VYAYIPELLACRAPSRREEFCPYTHEVDPLILDLKVGGTNLGIPHVKKGLTAFFQTFGLRHLPTLALTMIDIMECDDRRPEVATQRLAESQSVLIEDLRRLLRIEQAQCTPKELVECIQVFQEELRRSVLADEPLPTGLEHSSIGMELFNSLVPATGDYAIQSDRPSLIVNSRGLTEHFPVPAFLKATSVEVVVRNEETLLGKEVEDQALALTDQINQKLDEEPLRTFLAPWEAGAALIHGGACLQKTEWWIARVRGRLERMRAEIDRKKERATNEKGKAALQKQSEALSVLITRSIAVEDRARKTPPSLLPPSSEFIPALRALQELCTDQEGKVDTLQVVTIAKEEAYALFAGLMRKEAPDHIDNVLFPGLNPEATPEEVSRATRENWIKYFYEEYLEHFSRVIIQAPDENALPTEGAQDPVVIRQVPADLEALMHRLWRTRGTAELFRAAGYDKDQKVPDHPLVNVGRSVNALRRKINSLLQGEVSVEKTQLGIHPCHGIGRVLSGDIADACFHQHRDALARGTYPEITALLLSLPGKDQQLAGSVLCIDTENEAGERVLVIRALNPTDAILHRSLEASSVVEAVANYFIDAAKISAETNPEKPVIEVRICADHRGGHSTNRQSVYDAEQVLFKGPWKNAERTKALENNPSTKFNGYQIWVPGQTACIWRKPGA